MTEAEKFIKAVRETSIKNEKAITCLYNDWAVTYNPLAQVFIAERNVRKNTGVWNHMTDSWETKKVHERVIRRNESILAGILTK